MLPVALTRIVGRGRELAELERLIASQRLVTLTGVGGVGKTRLAAELARRSDGGDVAWIELAACSDGDLVPQEVAAALSLHGSCERGAVATITDALRDRDITLILDNCEHVIAATADLVSAILPHCPRIRIVTTSREPLGVAGEQNWPVPPIAPDEAVDLFVDRATAADPSFRLTDDNRAAVDEICRRLDGLPLAIELAAARVRVLTPQQITARLEDRFALLSGGARAMARHRTLRAAIDWSFALLSEEEQRLLARLSVFAGMFSIDAAEAVCRDSHSIFDALTSLVEKSLVARCKERYQLLETIRQYAAEKLATSDEAHEIRRRHAIAFRDLARQSLPELLDASTACLDRLDPDHDNVRAALAWSIDHDADGIAAPLAASFRWYWYYRILWSEGLRWMTLVLERSSPAPSADRAGVLAGAGAFAGYLADFANGERWLQEAESMWRMAGDDRQLALTLSASAQLLATFGDLDAAESKAAESTRLAMKAGTSWDLGYCLTNAAAFVAQVRGELETADLYLEEAESIWTASRHPLGLPFVLNARALLALRRRDETAATRLARAALLETRERRDIWFSARSLRVLASTFASDPLRAAHLLGAADAMLRSIGASMLRYEKAEHERLLTLLREKLSPAALEEAMREGSRMSFTEACDLALALPAAPPAAVERALLRINDLGPLQVTLGDAPLVFEGRSSGRAREMLAFLAAHPKGVTREEVGVAFWPDATTNQVKNSFHVALHRLRKMLGDADAVIAEDGRYRIHMPHEAASIAFEREVKAGQLEKAVAMYAGDYLQGEDAGEWCLPIRGHLRKLYTRALLAVGQQYESRGRYADAADVYARLVAREPFDESAWRKLMICRARLGQRSESLLLYRQLEERLRDELAAAPEVETAALYRRITQNEGV